MPDIVTRMGHQMLDEEQPSNIVSKGCGHFVLAVVGSTGVSLSPGEDSQCTVCLSEGSG